MFLMRSDRSATSRSGEQGEVSGLFPAATKIASIRVYAGLEIPTDDNLDVVRRLESDLRHRAGVVFVIQLMSVSVLVGSGG